jgi:hypothetical protein
MERMKVGKRGRSWKEPKSPSGHTRLHTDTAGRVRIFLHLGRPLSATRSRNVLYMVELIVAECESRF